MNHATKNRRRRARLALPALLWLSCAWWSHASPSPLTVSGEITAGGRPLAGAEARLLPILPASAAERHGGEAIATVHSRDDGRFAFTLPEPGPWAVEVAAPGRSTMRTLVEAVAGSVRLSAVELPPARLPDLPRPALPRFGAWQPAAKPAAGPESMAPDAGPPPLSGRVVDAATGRPLSAARVWSRPPARVALARTGADGRFILPRDDGPPPRSLGAAAADHHAVRVELDPGERLEIALQPRRRGIGWVVDAEERPVEGAEVRLVSERGEGPRRTLGPFHSDREGRYEVAEPPPGRYRLSVRAQGFEPVTVPGLTVAEGPAVDLGIVTLLSAAELVGRVVDDAGRPVVGARVALADAGPLPWQAVLTRGEVIRRAVSDDTGCFALADLSPGTRVRLRVEKEGFLAAEPAALAIPADAAEPLLEVVLERPATLSGWVVDGAGQGVAGALVDATPEAGDTRSAFTDGDGGFEIAGVTAGRWAIDASADGYRESRPADVVVTGGGEVSGLEIVLSPGASLAGRVVEADGRPAAGATLELTGGDGGPHPLTRSGADGHFRFAGLAPGAYRLSADDGGRRAERRIDLAGETEGLLLVLPAGVEVAGTVLGSDGTPVAGARALLVRAGGDGGSTRATSDAAGRFAWSGVPDGLHQLVVQADGLAPSPMMPVAVDGAPVTDLEVVLDAGVTLRGRVTGVDGRDLAALVVRTADRGGGSLAGVDPEGRFALPHLPVGEVLLIVELPGTGRRRVERVATPAGANEVEIEIDLP